MAVVVQRQRIAENAAAKILPGIHFKDGSGATFYYKYSKLYRSKEKDSIEDEDVDQSSMHVPKTFYELPVLKEATWKDVLSNVKTSQESENAINVLIDSAALFGDLDPEEEFIKNYKINSFLCADGNYDRTFDFVMSRGREECQVYGDLSLKHWSALLVTLSEVESFVPLGLQVMKEFVDRYGEPFHQNTRDLSQIKSETFIVTVVLIFEMCITESFSEFNALFRCKEEGLDNIIFGKLKFKLYEMVRELFILCLPYPKYINNKLRAVYSWFVKCWGVAHEEITVLKSIGGDDRNSKEVSYEGYVKFKNPYREAILHSKFFAKSKKENIDKVREIIEYVKSKTVRVIKTPNILFLLENVYETEFNPKRMNDVLLASYLLSIQTITGYGRAWVKNVGDDPDKMLKPTKDNFVKRLSDMTENYVARAYDEAEKHGYTIVKPESMYSALLRMAKNTSSGMSTSVEVYKTYGPRAEKKQTPIRVVSRQKALVIMREGDKIYAKENIEKNFNSVTSYQSKGQRDVPIKSTRTIYAINISVLAPQLLLTLPINEYFAQVGGSTRPNALEMGGKIIIGDLESTGSRVIDAGDTFRNTSDPGILTLALDYSEYDQHMTMDNFRNGMMNGMRRALMKYHDLRYEGMSVEDLLHAGYGVGRLVGSKWNGKRRVLKMIKDDYLSLQESDRVPPIDAPFKFSPPGVSLIRNLDLVKRTPKEGDEIVLVSPWDGSDLATVTTHLSGENTTLVWNSVHNYAAGTIIREEVASKVPNTLNVESETYVGDDMLFYTSLMVSPRGDVFDKLLNTIFETISLFGHEASQAKTTFLPFSAEKTQTHAKQGIYIGQDRMMFVSSERRKDIEDVGAYMKANVNVFVTKCSRGFSCDLAHIILCYKTMFVGYRKFKRTIMEGGKMRSRHYDSIEDGYTLCMVRNPLCLYLPIEWNGYGAHPYALNVVMTPEVFIDCMMMESFRDGMLNIVQISNQSPPAWNETKVDKRSLKTKTSMSLFSKLARKSVSKVLQNEEILKQVHELPLQGFGPTEISHTMMHSALLKEPKARTLLAPNYEVDYQEVYNTWERRADLMPQGSDLEISMQYCKIFEIEFAEKIDVFKSKYFPDVNLSPEFKNQKLIIGNRGSARQRMTYVDQIDSILRSDIIMRGFITSSHILAVLEEIGIGHSAEDYATIFSLMNLDEKVCEKLGNYIARDKIRFDAQKLNKAGAGGDEFSMSLDVCTQSMSNQILEFPFELTTTERDAVNLYASQILMLRAAVGIHKTKMIFKVTEKHKRLVQRVRMQSKLPRRRHIKALCANIRTLSGSIIAQQFI
ncbi:VP1 [CHeRI orbivirus 2-1]|nr:VP1 [CHeRI orbivirus 2-1]